MIFKLLYLVLFLSIDVLLYLRLGRKIIKILYWLIVAITIWLIAFILHLPLLHLKYLMPFNYFINLSGMVVQMLIIHYVGLFVTSRWAHSYFTDDIKQYSIRILSFVFNTAIFGVYFIVHLIFVLSWAG